ncbi:MAG: LPS assembly protein LptD [Bryobacteraceae bacterium]
MFWLALADTAGAQQQASAPPPPPAAQTSAAKPAAQTGAATPATPPQLPDHKTLELNQWVFWAVHQEAEGPIKKGRGNVQLESKALLVRADEMEYNEDTRELVAVGNVYYHSFEKNEQIWCNRLEYNTEEQKGKFYDVRGESMGKTVVRRGILSGNSPFHFEGEWAERIGDKYLLYHGWITNCKLPGPWWKLRGPKFDIIPGERAKAYRSIFLLRKIPIFYTPYFYHSLEKQPRHSGFLLPNLVAHSLRGPMVGLGYFWAIDRSFDITYRFFDYNTEAFAHHVDFRGKPRPGTDFDILLYGVQDRQGIVPGTTPVAHYSGLDIYAIGNLDLGRGWTGTATANYVSSFDFRQQWSESYNEAIGSEVHSVGSLSKDWSSYRIDIVAARLENFQSTEVPLTEANGQTPALTNAVIIHKLPDVELNGRDRAIWQNLPIWFSFYSSAGLLSRSQPLFNDSTLNLGGPQGNTLYETYRTEPFTPRLELSPHITSALHFWHFDLVPSVGIDEAVYGESQAPNASVSQQVGYVAYQVVGSKIVTSARDFSVDLIFPSLARVFNKKTIFGDKVKHVIEPRATYRYVTGIGSDFDRLVRFDETDLLSDTNELELSLTNRLYAKRGDSVRELFTWELKEKRYFDPTFGGAVVPGQSNVFAATADLSAYSFLLGPRSSSPIASTLRASPLNGLGVNWQADYDPRFHAAVDSGFSVDYHWKKYYYSAGNYEVHTNPLLVPYGNQYRARVQYGDPNNRGWNAGVEAVYDYRQRVLEYTTTLVTYNTDCCGFNVEYRRYNAGIRDESRLMFSFSIANVGTVGNLKKQDRLF